MSLYDLFMKPLEKNGIRKARKELIPQAFGNVLEIGAGTGANFKYYNMEQIDSLIISDKKLSKTISNIIPKEIECKELDVMELPYDDDYFDTIIHTLVFCSVPDVQKGLLELKRVLKPKGSIIFIEHVLPHKRVWSRSFKIINPVWKTIASGCHLTRDYLTSLTEAGFDLVHSNRFMNTVFTSGKAIKKDN